jgi:unsaturated rhamnogalacturonyl hydrolase
MLVMRFVLLMLMLFSGLTANAQNLDVKTVRGASDAVPTVLLIGGLTGNDESARIVTQEIVSFEASRPDRRPFRLQAIPIANASQGKLQFPPAGVAYRENPESHALWRWIGTHAPDFVLIVAKDDYGLADALSKQLVAGVGRVPARRVDVKPGALQTLPRAIARSEASREIERRLGRTPRQLMAELAAVYGHDFNQLTYLPGMALIGQMRMGRVGDVQKLSAPYVSPARNTLERANSLTIAGHLVFAELAERTGDARYLELARKAADLGFTETGEMKESMPFHEEMSDSVFMAMPILVKAGNLTGDPRYYQMAARHLTFMQKLVLRPDGLYRHSPLTDAAWGRGNAFPALGLILALSDFPRDRPEFPPILEAFRQHMSALSGFQNEDGMWRQVIDHPGSYSEYSATAMIAIAMLRGINNGWLDPDIYQPLVDNAWRAVVMRTASDGRLVDVCESTNKQKSLDDYLRRGAILDRDPRGGGMALLFATEMAGLY